MTSRNIAHRSNLLSAAQLEGWDVAANTADLNGGGVYVAEGRGCATYAQCYTVQLDNVNISGNAALRGRGGGVFWRDEGTFEVLSCPADETRAVNLTANLTAELVLRRRKPPAQWYGALSRRTQLELLATLGPGLAAAAAAPVREAAAYTAGGQLAPYDLAAVRGLAEKLYNSNGSSSDNGSSSSGDSGSDGSTDAGVAPQPAAVAVVRLLLNDTTWQGLPASHLPCSGWQFNRAGGGDDVASTPFYALVQPRVDFYSSNTELSLPVFLHDWLGQNCTGDQAAQPFSVTYADSPLVSGTTRMLASNGSAHFLSIKLRAREGPHNVSFYARMNDPNRLVKADQVGIKCKVGFYNFDVKSETCKPCPDNAECRYPGEAESAGASGDGAATTASAAAPAAGAAVAAGYLVPADGYWHSSFFSDQIIECPNPDSCTTEARSNNLTALQVQIWQSTRLLQMNDSLVEAELFGQALLADSVGRRRRRLLQDAAVNSTSAAAIAAAALPLLKGYMGAQCAEGYMGALCGECAPGWGWIDIATCTECPSQSINALYYALATLLTVASLALAIHASLRAQTHGDRLGPSEGGGSRTPSAIGRSAELEPERPAAPHQHQQPEALPPAPLEAAALFAGPAGWKDAADNSTAAPLRPGAAGEDVEGSSRGWAGEGPRGEAEEASAESRAELSTVMRIFIAYLQVLGLLNSINIDAPPAVNVYNGLCDQSSGYPGTLVSLDCSLPDDMSVSKATFRTLLNALAPFYAYAAVLVILVAVALVKYPVKRKRQDSRSARQGLLAYVLGSLQRQWLTSLCTVMFFFYPTVVTALLSIYDCQGVDSPAAHIGLLTDSVWKQDFGATCYEGEHLALALGLGIPGLLIVGLGWPVLSALIQARKLPGMTNGIFKSFNELNEINHADYRPNYLWWESAVLVRQLALSLVVVFMASGVSVYVQLLVLMLILVVNTAIQTMLRPYRCPNVGTLALASMYILIATVYLMLYLPATGDAGRNAVGIILVVLNALTAAGCLWYITLAYWWGMLDDTGLAKMDTEQRRRMTYSEIRAHIIEHKSDEDGNQAGKPSLAKSLFAWAGR
eukprot:XP_001702778.1 predicted protein [Chlamydomonas reinhardtii]